ncbi:MAG: hypothetical protein IKO93_11695 [Lentisphaeria bacterium]|nr:hypothetical protein [Lentisphaeria bacterium]
MNFYQRIISAITLAVIGLTIAVIRVCFEPPYSDLFITECIAVIWAEFAAGTAFVLLCRKKDSMLPYALAVGWIPMIYLLFTLAMIFPAMLGMQLKYFILLHAAGLTFAAIAYGIFVLGEHNIREQEQKDPVQLENKKNFYQRMRKIANEIPDIFPDQLQLWKTSEKLAENLLFCACSRPGLENADQEIECNLIELQNAVSSADQTECERLLKLLQKQYLAREEQAKSLP